MSEAGGGGVFDQRFLGYFREQLVPALAPLEARRQMIRRRVLLAGPMGAALGGAACLVVARAASGFELAWPVVAAFLAVPALLALAIVWAVSARGFDTDFKERVIPLVAGYVDPALRFAVSPGIRREQFEASQIFTSGIDRYSSEDRVFGAVGQTAIEFSEVHAERKSTDSKGRTTYSTIFRGLFMIADFHKHFHGRTMVVPDFAERWMGRFGRSIQALGIGRPGSLVKLEDPEFERAFAVYSDDQIEARYILSPSMMRRILAFAAKTNSAVSLSFHDSQLYLAIALDRDLFEPRLFRSLLDPGLVTEFLRDLQRAVGVVEDLNLNTRIWSKA